MSNVKALRQPASLQMLSAGFLLFWSLLALFPIAWIAIMSIKAPLDAFAASPFDVILGPATIAQGNGLTLADIAAALLGGGLAIWFAIKGLPGLVARHVSAGYRPIGWILALIGYCIIVLLAGFILLPRLAQAVNAAMALDPIIGFTTQHYHAVWVENAFWQNFVNSAIVTTGVVTISLTVGTLAGYGLSRSGSNLAFWLLIGALVFRALPHSVLVAGYLPVFINSAELLRPLLGENAPTLYGQPLAVIIVLVSINQPFTIWMLRSFFQSIPAELDEAARVDGCTHFQAFRRVIMPVMWPGVITTGLFSFLLAYNDFLVTSLLLDQSDMTMVPAIAAYFNRETTTTDQVEAIAAAVSITAPLFLLVMAFQRQIVSGLTAGAVKG
ncbi:carbohydrate ABC transporter permease (plasmid) [Ensifer adhaerens]|uniref:carbohydrate ABC transporter permease n=1 Tax=Ensifer adhaerens TaxID=106592 RepID=UPI00210083DC|nr:carbohydrate ABC transporter permease [Ensifer adhaerens]UTV41846.1 carbohydrate ABC transporter permease [Ensifer adhaerens]